MNQSTDSPPHEKAAEDLFNYALDREAIKWLIARLPEDVGIPPATIEYELQLLNIIGTGWAVSYVMESSPGKPPLVAAFWKSVFEFSGTLSETTGRMTGQTFDYFQVVKDRLDNYVKILSENPDAREPAVLIGEEFARICGNSGNIFIRMTGAKLFMTIMATVRRYVEAAGLL